MQPAQKCLPMSNEELTLCRVHVEELVTFCDLIKGTPPTRIDQCKKKQKTRYPINAHLAPITYKSDLFFVLGVPSCVPPPSRAPQNIKIKRL